ncbi:hypothetical protein BJY04DRAFT_190871 [Aspergillus karnatakaensis]|uniref:YwbE family protein n=1 Tax=Aspergillus karnatakaensis TaxID=1810916 RepID=UPI003CCCE30B
MPRVPTTTEVIPGASVNIVLKADQPTGRTVSGTVGTLLTRGNHPRGIKVRLTDGRVGRVQSMASATATGTESEASLPQAMTGPAFAASRRTAKPTTELPSEQIGLDAYIKNPRRKGKSGNGRGNRQLSNAHEEVAEEPIPQASAVVTCPVCGDFEGDEAAVAHHVSSHFD